jgi:hypothetical protein
LTTCHEATGWLLEADLDELHSPEDRAVARHVAACPACTTRAERILGDTAWLARAIEKPTVAVVDTLQTQGAATRTRWTRATFVGAALLAASILVLLLARLPRPDGRSATSLRPTQVASSTTRSAAPSSGAARDVPEASSFSNPIHANHRPTQSPSRQLASAVAVAPVALAPESVPAIATPAVRLDTKGDRDSTRIEPRPSLAVDVVPSSGRYAVLGSTPRVTVVWFY